MFVRLSKLSLQHKLPSLVLSVNLFSALLIFCASSLVNAQSVTQAIEQSNAFASNETTVQFTQSELALITAFGPWSDDVPADPGNEFSGLAWAEALGERLFNDPNLSLDRSMSCASCHQTENGFSDNRPLAQGNKTHVRNTQGLLNVGLQRWFGWDGGADSLWAASLRPLLSEIEMNADIEVVAKRYRETAAVVVSLQDNGVSVSELDDESLIVLFAKMLGAYQRTLVSGVTAFDEFLTAILNDDTAGQRRYGESEKRGLKLFMGQANCHVCHFGPNFSNAEFHDIGRPFFTGVGQVDPGRYAGIKRVRKDKYNLAGPFGVHVKKEHTRKLETVTLGQANFGQWRTPSLRNLKFTAPYMHDGSVASLRGVIDFYADIDTGRLHVKGESVLNPQDWSEQDREDLERFLLSLSE